MNALALHLTKTRQLLLIAALVLATSEQLFSAEILGTITEGNATSAKVSISGKVTPAAGDEVEIFFKLAGGNDEISVAKGKVKAVTGNVIDVTVQTATGSIKKGQLARIKSKPPNKITAPAAKPSPTARPTSTPSPSVAAVVPTKSVNNAATATPKPVASATPKPGEWTDLTNASQRIVGSWKGPRHRTVFFANGTFITDPHLVPDPPLGRRQVQGDRLTQNFLPSNITATFKILSLSDTELVTRNNQGQTFHLTRLK